jgi:cyclophilin family peptidyl-prolyl cis-trans isomerase/protein-disulfide isomerase
MLKKSLIILIGLGLLLTACTPIAVRAPTLTPSLPVRPSAGLPTVDPNTASSDTSNCTMVSQKVLPATDSTEAASNSLFKPVNEADWTLGDPKALVQFLVYSDFQCPYCSNLAPILEQLQKDFSQDVVIIFRHFPIPSHKNASLAAQAAEAAGLQGHFWVMHNALFANQSAWTALPLPDFESWLIQQAKTLDLDPTLFAADLKSASIVKKIQAAQLEGQKIGIPGTPLILINGKIWGGQWQIPDNLRAVVQLLKLEKRQFSGCPPMTINPNKHYTVIMQTEKGEIDLELFADKAPITVNSFVFLARQGWFNDIIFHRVLPNFVAQTGDPSGTGYGQPGYAFKDEITPNLKFDKAGMVGMANAGANSNGSQFFIVLAPQPDLDSKFTVFGQVTKGMDVVNQITPRDPTKGGDLPPGTRIMTVTIKEQ